MGWVIFIITNSVLNVKKDYNTRITGDVCSDLLEKNRSIGGIKMPSSNLFDVPAYQGRTSAPEEQSESEPDTLDLATRGALALNGILGTIDPDLLTTWGLVHYAARRPHLSHWASAETLVDPKLAESITLMRVMSGGQQDLDLEIHYRAAILSRLHAGLYWDQYTPRRPWRNSYSEAFYGKGQDEDFATLPGAGRMLRTMLIWRELGAQSDRMETELRALPAGLLHIAVKKGDYAYYPEHGGWGEPCAYPRSGWLNTDEAQGETEGGEGSVVCMHGHQIYGAARWYRESHQGEALDLARLLTRYVMLPRFWGGVPDPYGARGGMKITHIGAHKADPEFTSGHEQGHWYSHFHARAIALRGILEYAWSAGDDRAAEFVRRAYEFTLTQGITRLGWINCYPAGVNHVEGCALGDLVALGIRLSDYGLGDYWDDVDAVVRNQLVEQQICDPQILVQISQNASTQCCENAYPGQLAFPEDIYTRTLGIYGGTALPTSIPNAWVMHCCTANASQGLYYAWEGAIRETARTAQVNLLLNRSTNLVHLESYLPYEGRVVIHNYNATRIAVRIPYWIRRNELSININDIEIGGDWIGNRILLEGLYPGDVIALTFPVIEQTLGYTVNANSPQENIYHLTLRGSTVVSVTPRDDTPTGYPMYLRDAMTASHAPKKTAAHFVPDKIVRGW